MIRRCSPRPAPRSPSAFAVLAVLAAGASIAMPAASAEAPESYELRVEPYEFEAASGEKVAAELGRFKVPENRTRPESRRLELAFVRFPCTSEECGPPIVYLAGGPGGSGIATARFQRFPLFMALREHGDVIAFDQRGTGESEPDLSCGDAYLVPLDRPTDPATAGKIIAAAARSCAERLTAEGHDISAYHTHENADDLEDLRRALGAPKLRLWGISYGSHLGLAMLRRHGESIDRAILAGIEPLHHTLKLPSDQQALLEEVARRAALDSAVRERVPDLLGSLRGLMERLEQEPVGVSLTHPMTGAEHEVVIGRFDLQLALTGMLRGPDELAGIPDLVYRLERGDWVGLGLQAGGNRLGEMWNMMSAAMDCASGQSTAWAERIAREASTTLLGDAINFPYPEVCEGVPVADLGDDFRAPVRSDVPVMLISGTLDGRTPPSNAEEVLPGLSKSTHLVVDGSGHDLYTSSPKVLEAMLAFLDGGEPPFDRIELDDPLRFQEPRTIAVLENELLERYVGDYRIREDELRRVIRAGNQLYTRRGEGPVLPIRPTSETEFFYEGSATHLRFVVGDDGAVRSMLMYHDGAAEPEEAILVAATEGASGAE